MSGRRREWNDMNKYDTEKKDLSIPTRGKSTERGGYKGRLVEERDWNSPPKDRIEHKQYSTVPRERKTSKPQDYIDNNDNIAQIIDNSKRKVSKEREFNRSKDKILIPTRGESSRGRNPSLERKELSTLQPSRSKTSLQDTFDKMLEETETFTLSHNTRIQKIRTNDDQFDSLLRSIDETNQSISLSRQPIKTDGATERVKRMESPATKDSFDQMLQNLDDLFSKSETPIITNRPNNSTKRPLRDERTIQMDQQFDKMFDEVDELKNRLLGIQTRKQSPVRKQFEEPDNETPEEFGSRRRWQKENDIPTRKLSSSYDQRKFNKNENQENENETEANIYNFEDTRGSSSSFSRRYPNESGSDESLKIGSRGTSGRRRWRDEDDLNVGSINDRDNERALRERKLNTPKW